MPVGSEGRLEVADGKGGDSRLCVVYYAPADGRLRAVTLFLLNRWAGAEVRVKREESALWIAQGERCIILPLPEGQ